MGKGIFRAKQASYKRMLRVEGRGGYIMWAARVWMDRRKKIKY